MQHKTTVEFDHASGVLTVSGELLPLNEHEHDILAEALASKPRVTTEFANTNNVLSFSFGFTFAPVVEAPQKNKKPVVQPNKVRKAKKAAKK